MAPEKHEFKPDYAIPPGEILAEMLEVRGIKKAEFAERCGRPAKTISGILNGHIAITPETAIQFERVLGTAASLWTNLEARYRLRLAEREANHLSDEQIEWARTFPIAKLVQHGAFPKPASRSERVRSLLEFFGVASVDAWNLWFEKQSAAYRRSRSFQSAGAAVAAWLRMGERAAEAVECHPFDRAGFIEALKSTRKLTTRPVPEWYPGMRDRCAKAGVAVVLIKELPSTRLSGAARWITKDKALIQLSLRHRSDDHFWFSFFHEAGHILLHGKKQLFLDDVSGMTGADEEEADRFAGDFLIAAAAFGEFRETGDFGASAIQAFAKSQGIAAGIVVGRLQHEELVEYRWHNALKVRLKWAGE